MRCLSVMFALQAQQITVLLFWPQELFNETGSALVFLPWLALQGLAFLEHSGQVLELWPGTLTTQRLQWSPVSTFSTNSSQERSLHVDSLDAPMGLLLPCNTIGLLNSANWATGSRGKITGLSKYHWESISSKERECYICCMIWAQSKSKTFW